MQSLPLVIEKEALSEIPEGLRGYYTEKEGKLHFDTQEIVPKAKLHEFMNNNRDLNARVRALTESQKSYEGIDPEEARKALEEQRKIKEKKLIDAGKIDEIISQRTERLKAEYQKQLQDLSAKYESTHSKLSGLLVDNAIRNAAISAGVHEDALDDVERAGREVFRLVGDEALPMDGDRVIYGKDGKTPLTVTEWLEEKAPKKAHWFKQTIGGGTPPRGGKDSPGGLPANGLKRSQMSNQDKVQYIRKHGQEAFLKLPLN